MKEYEMKRSHTDLKDKWKKRLVASIEKKPPEGQKKPRRGDSRGNKQFKKVR